MGGYSETEKSKCQDLPKFQWGGILKTEKSQSAKICLNFNFQGGVGGFGYSETEKSKYQDLPKFQWGGILKLKSHKVPRSA